MEAAASDISGSLVPMAKQQAMILLEAGYLWMDMGKHDNAKDVLSGAAALMPKSELPQIALGTLELVQGRNEKALQAFRWRRSRGCPGRMRARRCCSWGRFPRR
jgi:hypothetical protein